MILKNKTTEEILTITKLTNGIVYTIYENHYYKTQNIGETSSIAWSLDGDVYPDQTLTIDDNIHKQAYEYLLTLSDFGDYELSTDNMGWSMSDMQYRFFVDNNRVVTGVKNGNGLLSIMSRLAAMNIVLPADEQFITEGKTMTVAYRNSINPEDQYILDEEVNKSIFIELRP